MPRSENLHYRFAMTADAPDIARLHADSWRRHYRGAWSDAFLDHDVEAERLTVWTERLGTGNPELCTVVAESGAGSIIGFVHTVLNSDPIWGALVDNLHVAFDSKNSGIGTRLMAASAETVITRTPGNGLHLWVLEQNTAAQGFYAARGGRSVDRRLVPAPGGDPSRLQGHPFGLRIVWPDPATLVGFR